MTLDTVKYPMTDERTKSPTSLTVRWSADKPSAPRATAPATSIASPECFHSTVTGTVVTGMTTRLGFSGADGGSGGGGYMQAPSCMISDCRTITSSTFTESDSALPLTTHMFSMNAKQFCEKSSEDNCASSLA